MALHNQYYDENAFIQTTVYFSAISTFAVARLPVNLIYRLRLHYC